MSERSGFLGGLFDGDTLLWFIILFLLLFYCCGGVGGTYGGACGTGIGYKE